MERMQAGGGRTDANHGLALCSMWRDGQLTLGARTAGGVLDVARAAQARGVRAPLTPDAVLRGEDLPGLRALMAAATAGDQTFVVREQDVTFGPCVVRPEKIVMTGFNYRRHCLETNTPIPTHPVFFSKHANALLGHGGTVTLPVKVSSKVDYESELVVVVGRTARDVEPAEALSYVFGYCAGNDLSARDLQFRTSQYLIGKSCDGFAPIGPWLVSADQVGDPQDLDIVTRVNGETRQSSNTSDMIMSCAELVSFASRYFTLRPGDLLFTGTPEGVIQGMPEPRTWLKPGDEITTAIEKLGELKFRLA
jgi:2-keto-4-pentenoate hydratase/2-oxohepta-3-ene-1,7-dioic acid hydratase in catechol pathway